MASLRLVKSKPLTQGREHVFVARSVENTLQIVLFHVIVTSFSSKQIHLPQKMVVAGDKEPPNVKGAA